MQPKWIKLDLGLSDMALVRNELTSIVFIHLCKEKAMDPRSFMCKTP